MKAKDEYSIYDTQVMEDLLDEDELSPQEEAFMRGYMDEEENEDEEIEVDEIESEEVEA